MLQIDLEEINKYAKNDNMKYSWETYLKPLQATRYAKSLVKESSKP